MTNAPAHRPDRWLLALLLAVALPVAAVAQAAGGGYFRFTYANDYFTATDYYFTQGLRLEAGNDRRAWALVQEGYTPTSIRAAEILPDDRPYAGALYVSRRRDFAANDANGRWRTEFALGVLGPPSLAAAEQKWIHRQTGNVAPRGWHHQIATEPLLDYRLTHLRWVVTEPLFSARAVGQLRLGTYRSRAEVELRLRVGSPARETGVPRRFGWALHLRPAAQLALYDATLQGGLLNAGSPHTLEAGELRRMVGRLSGGVRLRWGALRLSFSHTYLNREFGTGRPHAWGTVHLGYGGRTEGPTGLPEGNPTFRR